MRREGFPQPTPCHLISASAAFCHPYPPSQFCIWSGLLICGLVLLWLRCIMYIKPVGVFLVSSAVCHLYFPMPSKSHPVTQNLLATSSLLYPHGYEPNKGVQLKGCMGRARMQAVRVLGMHVCPSMGMRLCLMCTHDR